MDFDHFSGNTLFIELNIFIKSDASHDLIDWRQNL